MNLIFKQRFDQIEMEKLGFLDTIFTKETHSEALILCLKR